MSGQVATAAEAFVSGVPPAQTFVPGTSSPTGMFGTLQPTPCPASG
jgi:hypothetical protein